ncbi:MAG: DUF3810 domain-containing protein [Lachnospiraceae bacterium]|nr:DUF3810 domain-containing protein [Lachnospiraceae bacterium]
MSRRQENSISIPKGSDPSRQRRISARLIRICVFLGIVLFNLVVRLSREFSDWYTASIFPVWGKTLGRFTSLFPFSVGEWAILFGLSWLFIQGILLLLWGAEHLRSRRHKRGKKARSQAEDKPVEPEPATRVDRPWSRRARRMLGGTINILLGIGVIMSLNCFVLYQCTPIDPPATSRSYTQTELAALRDLIVTECNERSVQVPRDPAGEVIFAGTPADEARAAMDTLGKRLLPRLSGWSVRPKTFFFSDFISQQHMMGYYFPFTMEANINGRMETLNKPFTMCHELAHTHGYLYEDEANLIGFLACLSSEDPVFVYSGYLGVLNYVNNDFYRSVGKEIYAQHPVIEDQVWLDARFLSEESWAAVEEHALFDTETVHSAATTFIDQNQKLNGIADGKASYTRVVGLLLSYYSGQAAYLK